MSLSPRSKGELSNMRKSGEITAKALKTVIKAVKPGMTLIELDKIAEEEIRKKRCNSGFYDSPRL